MASQDCHGLRFVAQLNIIAGHAEAAAGAGPSSVMASTSDRNAAETLMRLVSSRNCSLTAGKHQEHRTRLKAPVLRFGEHGSGD